MKKMSLKEFGAYCKEKKFDSYIYASDNQPYQNNYNFSRFTFNKIHINLFPGMVLLTSDDCFVQLNCVKGVDVEEECPLGTKCSVIYGQSDDKSNKNRYVFIANL